MLVGLGVYGNVYDKLDDYERQVSQWNRYVLFSEILPLFHLLVPGDDVSHCDAARRTGAPWHHGRTHPPVGGSEKT
jgi:hypothetical protein